MMSHTGKSFRRGAVWRCPAESISALKAEAMAVAVLVFANISLAQQPSSAYASSLISNRSNDMSVHTATQKRQIRMLVGEKSFSVTLADTRAAQKLAQLLPLTLRLHDYGGCDFSPRWNEGLPASQRVWHLSFPRHLSGSTGITSAQPGPSFTFVAFAGFPRSVAFTFFGSSLPSRISFTPAIKIFPAAT